MLSTTDSFTLYDNPLYCDCRLHWVATERRCPDAESTCSRRLAAGNQTRCAGPAAVDGRSLAAAYDDDRATGTCGPAVTALFDPVMYLSTGSALRLDCRVRGPTSSVVWITPGRRRRRRRLRVDRSPAGTVLSVRHLESRDAGTYRCVAVDADDANVSSSASTLLRLYNVDARVLPVSVGTASVVITWSGTESTLAAADYVVVYRPLPVRNRSDPATDVGTIHLRPYLRKYAINDLRPGRTYEFCIATEVSASDWMQLHCTRLTTRPPEVGRRTTVISRRLVVLVFVAALVVLPVLRCLLCVRQRGACRRTSRGTTSTTGVRTWSSSSSSLLRSRVPLKQFTSQPTDDDEHVVSSRTSLMRAVD